MADALGPVAASAVTFGATHLFIRHGPCHRHLERVFARRKEKGLIPPSSNPATLASQTGSRVLNEIHNLIAVPLSVVALFQHRLNHDKFRGNTPLVRFLTMLSAGYFCAETSVICNNFKEHGIEPLAHALVCVVFFCTVAVQRKLHWFVPRVLFFECSTPLVHARWFLANLGMSDTTLYKINGVAMIAAFFMCRVVWGTKLVCNFLREFCWMANPIPCNGLGVVSSRVITAAAAGISVLNYFWFYKMVRGAIKVFSRKKTLSNSSNDSDTISKEQANGVDDSNHAASCQ